MIRMRWRRSFAGLVFSLVAVLPLLAAPVALAQADDDGDDDEASDQAIMSTAIGCVATYDLVLARGLAGSHIADIQKARAQAREIYKQASGLDDDDTDADIAEADAHFPALLKDGNASLQRYRHACDDLMDQADDDAIGPAPVSA